MSGEVGAEGERRESELEHFWREYPDIDPAEVLVARSVPTLIGGPKDEHLLREVFEAGEAQAEQNYERALAEVQQQLAALQESGSTIRLIFVPDTALSLPRNYISRLKRLAQDIGLHVVIRRGHPRMLKDNWSFQHIEPPQARSVAAYWEGYTESPDVRPAAALLTDSDSVFLYDALLQLKAHSEQETATQPDTEISVLTASLFTLAGGSAERLQELFGLPEMRSLRGVLQTMAYESEQVAENDQGLARTILAQLNDQDSLIKLWQEIHNPDDPYLFAEKNLVPLGIYFRHNQHIAEVTLRRVNNLLTNNSNVDKQKRAELNFLFGALGYSGNAGFGQLMLRYFKDLPELEDEDLTIAYGLLRDLPEYVAAAQATQTVEQQSILSALEMQLRELLVITCSDPLPDNVYELLDCDPLLISNALIAFRNPAHRDLLERYTIHLLESVNGLITERHFARHYLKFRAVYGDLPEVSRRIHITSD